jgi:hypothetical protein
MERSMRGRNTDPAHVHFRVGDDSAAVIAMNGDPILVYLKQALPASLYRPALRDWWPASKDEISNRFSAMSTKGVPGINLDGTETNRLRVSQAILDITPARQGMIGYAVAKGRCYKTGLSISHPGLIENHIELIELVDSLYKYHLPSIHARQWAHVAEIPNWRIGRTAFSTGYFAKLLQCGYHPDLHNLRDAMSCIFPMGPFTGGELVLFRWRIAVAYVSGDLLLFNPKFYHGNLPFTGLRMSAVFFCDKNIAKCRDCGQSE